MKKIKNIYYVSTVAFSVLILMGVFNYITQYEMVAGYMLALGYPAYLVGVLGVAKVSGLTALWHPKVRAEMKQWAYAGFFFALSLAFLAHVAVGDGNQGGALVGLVLMLISYVSFTKIKK